MATTMSEYGAAINRPLSDIVGLSTDTKPLDKIEGVQIQNGSTFTEMDTNKIYAYDAENRQWKLQSSGGGGGGGSVTGTPILVTPTAIAGTINEAARVITLKGGSSVLLPSGERRTVSGSQYYIFTEPINSFSFVSASNLSSIVYVLFTCGTNMIINYSKGSSTWYDVLDNNGNKVTDLMIEGKTYYLQCRIETIRGNIDNITGVVTEYDEPIAYKIQ